MNEKINLCEILKDCPKGTKLYSPLFGEVKLLRITEKFPYCIVTYTNDNEQKIETFCEDGRFNWSIKEQECLLFPSKENRDWNTFKPKKSKFNPNILQPFDKILKRHRRTKIWFSDFCSCNRHDTFVTIGGGNYDVLIPYNNETKYLAGTTEEAPEYYRYWED